MKLCFQPFLEVVYSLRLFRYSYWKFTHIRTVSRFSVHFALWLEANGGSRWMTQQISCSRAEAVRGSYPAHLARRRAVFMGHHEFRRLQRCEHFFSFFKKFTGGGVCWLLEKQVSSNCQFGIMNSKQGTEVRIVLGVISDESVSWDKTKAFCAHFAYRSVSSAVLNIRLA
jgi:hypothetical protein